MLNFACYNQQMCYYRGQLSLPLDCSPIPSTLGVRLLRKLLLLHHDPFSWNTAKKFFRAATVFYLANFTNILSSHKCWYIYCFQLLCFFISGNFWYSLCETEIVGTQKSCIISVQFKRSNRQNYWFNWTVTRHYCLHHQTKVRYRFRVSQKTNTRIGTGTWELKLSELKCALMTHQAALSP